MSTSHKAIWKRDMKVAQKRVWTSDRARENELERDKMKMSAKKGNQKAYKPMFTWQYDDGKWMDGWVIEYMYMKKTYTCHGPVHFPYENLWWLSAFSLSQMLDEEWQWQEIHLTLHSIKHAFDANFSNVFFSSVGKFVPFCHFNLNSNQIVCHTGEIFITQW